MERKCPSHDMCFAPHTFLLAALKVDNKMEEQRPQKREDQRCAQSLVPVAVRVEETGRCLGPTSMGGGAGALSSALLYVFDVFYHTKPNRRSHRFLLKAQREGKSTTRMGF